MTSASVRNDAAGGEEAAHRDAVRSALASLTRTHYGPEERIDAALLDAALDAAARAAATLARQRTWRARTRAAAVARLRVPPRFQWFR
jgi:hypothetical protein